MDPTQEEQRQRMRDALSSIGISAAAISSFDDSTLDKLIVAKFHLPERLPSASREDLKEAGLALGDVSLIISKVQGSVSAGPATESLVDLVAGLVDSLDARLGELTDAIRHLQRPIVVTPSECPTDKRIEIEGILNMEYAYCPSHLMPCCLEDLPSSATCLHNFDWPNPNQEDAVENVTKALEFFAKLVPEGVVFLPVQGISWLESDIVVGKTTIVVSKSKTDYVFVPQEAWAKCQAEHGASIKGRNLCVKSSTTAREALQSMLGSMLGLYEAKTPSGMAHSGVPKVRAQALLEYLAINQMRKWPVDDVVVLFGDLNTHYAVHAGRKDMGQAKRSLHVAGPPRLADVAEGSPAAAEHSGSPESVTAAFIRALLSPRGNAATETRIEGAGGSGGGAGGSGGGAGSSGGGAGGSGGGAGGSGGGAGGSGGGAGGSGGGPGGNQQGGAARFRSGGDANPRDGDAARSKREATGSGGAPTGGSEDACSSAGADDGGGEGSVSGADSSSDGGGFDGDEGLLEAAQENQDAQVFMSLLRKSEVYKDLGLSEPPTSFRPPTKEETLARFRPWED